jgi:hypothetical protein
MPRRSSAETNAERIAATFPAPPISATNRPPGRKARYTEERTAEASRIQCRAALLKTASNSASKGKDSARATRASRPRARAPRDLLRAGIDGHDQRARRDQLLRERAVAAAEVEDPLPWPGREQVDHRGAEVGHEARVLGVGPRIPLLLGHLHIVGRARGRRQIAGAAAAGGLRSSARRRNPT